MKIPTAKELEGYVNKNISEICGCGFHNNARNHCAHFVCHVCELRFGYTCFPMGDGSGSQDISANVRVHEVFAQCRRVGTWANKPADLRNGFIFVTAASNVNLRTKVMTNVERKHIGIFIGQDVWQYKNRFRHVIKQTPADFGQHYGNGYATFYGEFPL